MLEEKLINSLRTDEPLISKELDEDRKEEVKNSIFRGIIGLMNEKSIYMLGPEKTKVAAFISNHYDDVHKILKFFKERK